MDVALRLLRERAALRPIVVPDGDVDGLSSGVLAYRTIERLGGKPRVLHPGKGEHVHTESLRRRLRAARPGLILVLDMGSRSGPILPSVPTMVVDHHQPHGFPDGATVVSSFGHEPTAPCSVLAYELFQRLARLDDLDWVMAIGSVADLGVDAEIDEVKAIVRRFGRKNITEAVALLNAPRRSATHDVETAFRVLLEAKHPSDIARGRVPGVDRLREARGQVASEMSRCARIAPRISGGFALISFSSAAKVHPLVARRWMDRLSNQIVIAANYNYLPGKVNFAIRSKREQNLISLLRKFPLPAESDTGYGHPRATGGSVSIADFERLITAMGFDAKTISAAVTHVDRIDAINTAT